jgi:hypothetical protein
MTRKDLAVGHREKRWREIPTSPQALSPRGEDLAVGHQAHGHHAALTLAELQARGVVWLTKTQMAAALQISVRSLNGMMQRGEIAYFKIGSLVRFRLEDALKRMSETVLIGGNAETLKR